MNSVFKKLPDLSYRSHKLQGGDSSNSFESFDIRPSYLDRGFVDSSKWANNNRTSSAESSTGVTGIPNLVELDDAMFNTLDPGQLLRESAAAATRAALASEPLTNLEMRRRKSSRGLVDDLLQEIYRGTSLDDDDDEEEEEAVQLAAGGASFSPKCVDPLKRKGILILHTSG